MDAFDEDGSIVVWNKQCELVTGYPAEEAIGNPAVLERMYLDSGYRNYVKKTVEADADNFGEVELEITCADGNRRTILWSNISTSVPIPGWVSWSIGLNITPRKRAEEALRGSMDKYSWLFENTQDFIYQTDLRGRLIFASPSSRRLLGYTLEELLGRSLSELYTLPEQEARLMKLLMENGSVTDFEAELTRRDGSRVWVSTNARLIRDEKGNPLEVGGVSRDITAAKTVEEALRESEERLSQIINFLPDATFAIDREGRVIAWNRAIEEMMGVPAEKMIGKGNYEYALPGYGTRRPILIDLVLRPDEESRQSYSFFKADNNTLTVEAEHATPRGKKVTLWAMAAPLYDMHGNVVGAIESVRDITERKKAEEALREREHTLRSILVATPVGLCLTVNHVIKWANSAWERMFGFTHETEYVGRPTRIMYGSEAQYLTARAAAYNNLYSRIVGETHTDFMRRDGSQFSGYLRCTYLDPSDPSKGMVSAISDLTEIAQAERALREGEERYRSLFEESRDGVYSVLRGGEITDANASFLEIFGYTREEMIGKNVHILYSDPADRAKFQREIEKEGFVKDYEIKFRKKDGTEVDCLLTSSVHFGEDGSIAGYRGILRDLSAYKALLRQLFQAQKMEAIGTLAGGVAHDFNNILQVTLGYSELILGDEKLPARYRTHLKKIHESARRGADLVHRLLTFSKKTDIRPRPLNLNRRITEMRKMLERTIPKMIDIQLSLGENLAAINADPTQVDQILMNLAVNARDAMPDGGKLIVETANIFLDEGYAKTHLDASPGCHVLLIVTDTGSGMDRETLEHIFEPFYTTKGVGRGTGLGLAMVHGIVKQHGGHIRCYSEPGEGSTFKIYLPALISDEEQEEAGLGEMPRHGSETILLVDDEEFIRDLGSMMLTKAGYRVITASNGKEALEVYQARGYEIALVLLDLLMPEMGGRQCLENLLSLNASVKVVIASGYSVEATTRDALATGAKGFVNKPYDSRQMLEVLREVLDAE